MDFPAIFAALDQHGYQGFITIELYTCANNPDEAARLAIAYLRDFVNQSNREKHSCV